MERLQQIMSTEAPNQVPLPTDLADKVELLKPFLGEKSTVYLTGGEIRTSPEDGEGASVAVDLNCGEQLQAYHHKQLTLLAQVAQTIDWGAYPQPCMFRGDRLRGAIVGQRV